MRQLALFALVLCYVAFSPVAIAVDSTVPSPDQSIAWRDPGATEASRAGAKTQTTDPDQTQTCPVEPDAAHQDGNCSKSYIIEFSAKWCNPCRKMKPVIEELEKDYFVYIVDADAERPLVDKLEVTKLPTIIVMDGGKEVERFIGVTDIEKIKSVTKTKAEQQQSTKVDYNLL